MKFKALLLALAVAGAGSSLALAEGGPTTTTTTGTTTTTKDHHGDAGCRKVFRGIITAVGSSSFTVDVVKGEHGGSGVSTSSMTVEVTPNTYVSWVGKGSMSGPNVGDKVRVFGKQCASTDPFTAVWVMASAPWKHGQGASTGQAKPENHSK